MSSLARIATAALAFTAFPCCAEHERPESQCVLCHPELAKKGIK